MVRLVTSRIHRCYSRRGGQRSSRNERLNDIAHIVACSIMLLDRDISFFSLGKSLIVPASVSAVGLFLLCLVHAIDLLATFNAHRVFYYWARTPKKRGTFLSTPTKVDTLIATCYLCSCILSYICASSLIWKSPIVEQREPYIHLTTSSIMLLGAVANMTLSLPSLDYRVPPPMSRAQTAVVSLFVVGCVVRMYSAFLEVFFGNSAGLFRQIYTVSAIVADVIIWFGSAINMVRVSKLLPRVHMWTTNEFEHSGRGYERGLLSWFKASRSNFDGSDFDSDGFEDISLDFDDHNKGAKSAARRGWSRV